MIDAGLYRDITDFAWSQQWFAGIATTFTEYGVFLIVPVILALLWRARTRGPAELAAAAWVPIAVAVALIVDTVLKSAVAEVRPCRVVPNVHTLLPCDAPTDYAFPSNHTVIVASFAVALLLVHRKWGIWALVFAVLIGISRVYVGAHYPHDVLAGFVVGAAVASLGLLARVPLEKIAVRLLPVIPGRKA
ncbi:phosphatase PAP2 family protein [Amycolatopsis benzoatilytica]|uniref:phosphatase PAP2 family protein n=1 Tax=Amycolatopsis benzoatilytica TaxID=346045 RepID=UPI00036D03E8|nr:phosphatase PAP2 family protein [Amycolatopsis benzoatilytica]